MEADVAVVLPAKGGIARDGSEGTRLDIAMTGGPRGSPSRKVDCFWIDVKGCCKEKGDGWADLVFDVDDCRPNISFSVEGDLD